MKTKPYVRYIDFIVVLLSLDFLHFLLSVAVMAVFGPDKEDPVVSMLLLLVSTVLFWGKIGLGVLFWKKIPFRPAQPDASVAFTKVWTMAFFWPLLFTK